MEKISNVVRGSARVASTDTKAAGAVRPGALAFGRPVGESPQGAEHTETTAARAASLQHEMNEQKKIRAQDRTVQNMADQFFMTRIRRPDDDVESAPIKGKARVSAQEIEPEAREELNGDEQAAVEAAQPSGYTPRGSYVNVHA
jgi:hypothetical protein